MLKNDFRLAMAIGFQRAIASCAPTGRFHRRTIFHDAAARSFWVARASRALVLASRQNKLRKVRDDETSSPTRETRALPSPVRPTRAARAFNRCGLDATPAMACDGRDASLRLARGRAIENSTAMGLLVFPSQQCPLGRLGLARSRVGLNCSSIWLGRLEHPGRGQKRQDVSEQP